MTVSWNGQHAKENARLENQCYEQAAAELADMHGSGLEYIRKVLNRAQEIKREKNGNNNSRK